jgi:flavin reductase (DIM6/NTAB) family NADH-FMN oxidoreductase RutF
MKEILHPHHANRMLNPGLVALVTSHMKGQPNIMAAAWLTPMSFDPPIVGMCVSPRCYTHEFIVKSEQFVLNIPSIELMKQVHYCGHVSGRDVDKFKQTGLTPTDPIALQTPLIEECIGHIECGVINAYEVGDHTLFVAEVVAVQAEKEAFEERWLLKVKEATPLHHLSGRFFSYMEKPFEIP